MELHVRVRPTIRTIALTNSARVCVSRDRNVSDEPLRPMSRGAGHPATHQQISEWLYSGATTGYILAIEVEHLVKFRSLCLAPEKPGSRSC